LRTSGFRVAAHPPPPPTCGDPTRRDAPGTVRKYVSSNYILHSFESPTGYRFLMTASRDAGDLRGLLADLYSTIFLPHAVYNPLYEMGTEITCPRFIAGVKQMPGPGYASVQSGWGGAARGWWFGVCWSAAPVAGVRDRPHPPPSPPPPLPPPPPETDAKVSAVSGFRPSS
jgi:hypothetical protein